MAVADTFSYSSGSDGEGFQQSSFTFSLIGKRTLFWGLQDRSTEAEEEKEEESNIAHGEEEEEAILGVVVIILVVAGRVPGTTGGRIGVARDSWDSSIVEWLADVEEQPKQEGNSTIFFRES